MYDQDRPRHRYRSRSREHDYDLEYDEASYRRGSPAASPPRGRHGRERDHEREGHRDESDPDYYHRSRKEDEHQDYHHNTHQSHHSHHHSHHQRRQPHDTSLPYDDDQADLHHQRDRRVRSRSRSPRRHAPGRPSSTVIVEGLPADATEDDILDGFASASPDAKVFHADKIKAIRLRNNKRGRRIGFVEFYNVNDAAHFLEYHYPGLEFQLAHSRGVDSELVNVGINYSRGREDEAGRDERPRDDQVRDEQDWTCPECTYANYGSRSRCHRCRTTRPDGYHRLRTDDIMAYGPPLTGETDECPQQFPSQYLVIRGLDPTISEELFAEGVKKLYVEAKPEPKKESGNKLKSTAPTANTASLGAKPDSLRRVFLIRDKKTDEAMRYGFAEFATLDDAQGAVSKFRASPNITISSKPVTVAFIHAGVFIPHTSRVTEDNSRYVFNPIYNRDIFLKYWDNRVYPSILRVTDDVETAKRPSSDAVESIEKHGTTAAADELTTAQDAAGKKLKKFKLSQSTAKPAVAMGPQMQMWAKKRAELAGQAKREADERVASSPTPSERPLAAPKRAAIKDTYTSFSDAESLSCMLCMRKFASLMALRDHEVLDKAHQANRLDNEKRAAAAARLKNAGKTPRIVALRIASALRRPADRMYTSYADKESMHCLVCQRKFTKPEILSLHERESEMHRRNMADQSNIERAILQLARIGKVPRKMVPNRRGAQYRDRAQERRRVYNQPNAPRRKAPASESGSSSVSKQQQQTAAPLADKAAVPSKGAALLGKMGWTAGEGLGADRSGRTDAIATDVYAAGVGLGAEGGKLGDAITEAARKTKDNYTDFLEVTRKKARERYEKMG
ncbi:hypothetical protein BD289DRAFT_151361 [Coniella lustricola]|uniref:G-patch domain-containing protein n=1 Tax=Coniella lustricola TaxID=2025994 RepID=A0A2T2ZUR8_9PEZI|nr:hypothetical protein BD289DRAFT_151361 [Coniella lustricola]